MEILLSLVAVLTGGIIGVVTGLIPGLHINAIAALMVGFSGVLFAVGISPVVIAVFIVSVAITHSFYDFVPSLFLGVPADETYALLPGQQMVREGNGLEALQLSIIGSWRSLFLSILLLIFLIIADKLSGGAVRGGERALQPWMFWILLVISFVLVFTEEKKLWATVVFLCSGIYGLVVLSSPLVPGGSMGAFNVLFPALTGLFGVSGLILSLFETTSSAIKQNKEYKIDLSQGQLNSSVIIGSASGMMVGLLPGLGGANAATLVLLVNNWFTKNKSQNNGKTYILMTSAISTSDALFGITALYLINKSRSGASVAIDHLLSGAISLINLIYIICGMLVAGLIAKFTLTKYGFLFSNLFSYLDYKALSMAVLTFILLLVYLTTGVWGMIILAGSSFIGIIPPLVKIRRAQAMGFFLIPVLLFFSGYQREISTWLSIEAKLSPVQEVDVTRMVSNVGISFAAGILLYLTLRRMFKRSNHTYSSEQPKGWRD